jgi:hypothetical protein
MITMGTVIDCQRFFGHFLDNYLEQSFVSWARLAGIQTYQCHTTVNWTCSLEEPWRVRSLYTYFGWVQLAGGRRTVPIPYTLLFPEWIDTSVGRKRMGSMACRSVGVAVWVQDMRPFFHEVTCGFVIRRIYHPIISLHSCTSTLPPRRTD